MVMTTKITLLPVTREPGQEQTMADPVPLCLGGEPPFGSENRRSGKKLIEEQQTGCNRPVETGAKRKADTGDKALKSSTSRVGIVP
jgi:hypothetical protein